MVCYTFTNEGDDLGTLEPGDVLKTCGSWNGQVWESTTIVWVDMSANATR